MFHDAEGVEVYPVPAETRRDIIHPLRSMNVTEVSFLSDIGVILLDREASLSLYHLVADSLLPYVWWSRFHPTGLTQAFVHLYEKGYSAFRRMCYACMEITAAFGVSSFAAHHEDNHDPVCFCRALLVQRHGLPSGGGGSRHRAVSYEIIRRRLIEHFRLSEVDSHGKNDVPKLLLIQRKVNRRIAELHAIEQLSRQHGFEVRTVQMEDLTVREQLAAVVVADVVVASHGMALGLVFMMRRSPTRCRTVLELRHRVRPFPRFYQFTRAICEDCGLHYMEEAAIGARFGPSVKAHEESLLMDPALPIAAMFNLKGFFDQTAFYNLSRISVALEGAVQLAQSCPG
jgi:hypothetical protein